MSDAHVDRWNSSGRIACWRYRDNQRNYPGWHLTADAAGADALLDLVARMSAAPTTSERTIPLATPTAADLEKVGNPGARHVSVERLHLRHRRETEPAEYWRIVRQDTTLEISLGMETLAVFEEGVADIRRGHGDWSMGEEEPDVLWFW